MHSSWLRNKRENSCLLPALLLEEAFQWLADHSEGLGNDDLDYVFRSSNRHAEEQFDCVMMNQAWNVQRRAARNKLFRIPAPLLKREMKPRALIKLRLKRRLLRSVQAWNLSKTRATARRARQHARQEAARQLVGGEDIGPNEWGRTLKAFLRGCFGQETTWTGANRWGPALRAFLLCLLIGGSGVGYVWQKDQIFQLGRQIKVRELRLIHLKEQNASDLLLLQKMGVPGSLPDTNTNRSLKGGKGDS
jgi:hypothetical protein